MKLEEVRNNIKELEYIEEVLKENIDLNKMEVNEVIFRLYLKLENVKEVSKKINDLNFRIKTDRGYRKYIHQDISDVLKNKNAIKDKKLASIVTKIFRSKRKNFYT